MRSDKDWQGASGDVAVVIPLYGKSPTNLPILIQELQRESVGEIIIGASAVSEIPRFEGVTVIRAEQRLTPSSAKNRGAYHATQKYLLFLDADNLIQEGAVETMCAVLGEGGAVIAAAATYYQEDHTRVSFYGATHRHWTGWTRRLNTAPQDMDSDEHKPRRVRIEVAANAYMISRSDFITIGGFDEVAFPCHFEESDLSYRASQLTNKEIVCCLDARVYNDMPFSALRRLKSKDPLRSYYNARSRAIFTARHLGSRAWWTYALAGQFAFGSIYLWSEMRGLGNLSVRFRSMHAYIQGMVDGMVLSRHERRAFGSFIRNRSRE